MSVTQPLELELGIERTEYSPLCSIALLGTVNQSDIIYTPPEIAKEIVEHFKPTGRILDPCKGGGAFANLMPGCDWCEIREGKNFYDWKEPVDWIVSNPPYSTLDDWMKHSYTVAKNIVYLLPLPKLFNSAQRLRMISERGGIKELLVTGGGARHGFPWGYACGAFHFVTGYKGACQITMGASA